MAERGAGHMVFHFASKERWPEIRIDTESREVATEGNKMRGLGTKIGDRGTRTDLLE